MGPIEKNVWLGLMAQLFAWTSILLEEIKQKIRCFAFSAKAVSKVANKFYKICVCSIFQAYYIYRSGQCNTLTDLKLDIDYVHLLSDLHLD